MHRVRTRMGARSRRSARRRLRPSMMGQLHHPPRRCHRRIPQPTPCEQCQSWSPYHMTSLPSHLAWPVGKRRKLLPPLLPLLLLQHRMRRRVARLHCRRHHHWRQPFQLLPLLLLRRRAQQELVRGRTRRLRCHPRRRLQLHLCLLLPLLRVECLGWKAVLTVLTVDRMPALGSHQTPRQCRGGVPGRLRWTICPVLLTRVVTPPQQQFRPPPAAGPCAGRTVRCPRASRLRPGRRLIRPAQRVLLRLRRTQRLSWPPRAPLTRTARPHRVIRCTRRSCRRFRIRRFRRRLLHLSTIFPLCRSRPPR